MKKILVIALAIIALNSYSQKKELTLSDAVMSYYRGLTPKNLSRLEWVHGENNYIYLENECYIIKGIDGETTATIQLTELQKKYLSMEVMPSLLYVTGDEITFEYNNKVIRYNYKKGKETESFLFNNEAENTDYSTIADKMAFTVKNNLYVASSNNPKFAVTSITDTNIVSGQSIHRQEFGIVKGTFWSPLGNFLAFYQKDETNVTNYPLVDITTYPATLNYIKYPMAGQGSEQAKIGIYSTVANKVIYLKINTSDEHYLTNLSWSPDEKYVLVAEVNREQNHMWFNRYNVATGEKVNTVFEEENDKWVEPEHIAEFLPNSTTDFLWMSERDGFMNLYLYNIDGKLKKQLTKYSFVVKSIIGFGKKGHDVFIETTGNDPRNSLTYKVNLSSGKSTNITTVNGVHYTQLSHDGQFLINNYSNLSAPRIVNIVNSKTRETTTLFTAENPLKDYEIGSTEFVTLKSKDGFDLFGRVIKPADFDSSKKYPVLIYVYGGTHVQLITNRWMAGASMWMNWLATQKEYIVFSLDNRGSENRGFAFESVIHRKAGEAAMEDQLTGVDYLKTLPYVNSNRIAIHGWSYGGFMTCSLMLRHPGVFTTAVAGGPVTDWKYYEVMYGERYMDTPQENPEGYENSRVAKYIGNLNGKLLIIIGSVDPTVVPQHSMTLLKAAIEENVQLDFFTYPMHPHNVRGKDRIHLMTKVLDYILENNK